MTLDIKNGAKSTSVYLFIFIKAALFIFVLQVYTASGQGSVRHQAPTVVERGQSLNLEFDLPNINSDQIEVARLFYTFNGTMGFEQIELSPTSPMTSTYEAELPPIESGANQISYYASFDLINGQTITYPDSRPESNPVEVDVVESRDQKEGERTAKTDTVTGEYGKIEYSILSPEPGTSINPDDALIAVTFFYQDSPIPSDSLQIKLNGNDVTEDAEVDSYFISYIPEDLSGGNYNVEISYTNRPKTTNKTITNWEFTSSESAAITAAPTQTKSRRWPELPVQGRAELSARNQVIGGNTNNAYRGNIRVSGQEGELRYSLNGRLTSQEDPRRQPQNRLGGEILYDDWFELRAGHIYPNISNYSISGRRVMGINSEIKLLNENINLEVIYGRLNRNIDNLYNPIQTNYDTLSTVQEDPVVDTTFTLDFKDNGRGTHNRNIRGGRIAFGNKNYVQLGFHAMQIRDDTTSITTLDSYEDITRHDPSLLNQGLSSQERNYLESNTDQLNVTASNPQPKDNFVTGTDFLINLDQKRIRIRGEASASLLNENIAGGHLDSARADDIGVDLDSDIENYLSTYKWLFIVNENMSVLPFRFEEQNSGTTQLSPFVPQSIFAGESEVSLNYFNNNLKLRYRWIGPEYTSLANTTHRKDLAGFSISDRIRMFDNRIYLTLEYENLRNNVVGNRDATTNTNSYRTNVSWYPVRQTLPRVSIGWRYRIRDNDVQRINPYLEEDNISRAIRNVASDSTTILPDPKSSDNILLHGSVSQQFELWDITHDASLNTSYQKTNDDVFEYGNTESFTYSLNLSSRFNELPLNTNLGTTLNLTEAQGGLNEITIWGVRTGGTYFLMDDKLEIQSNITLTRNVNESTPLTVDKNEEMDENLNLGPSERVLNDVYAPNVEEQTTRKSMSYVLRGSAQYNINQYHSFVIDLNYNNVVSIGGNFNTPNDRIIQARYIFNF